MIREAAGKEEEDFAKSEVATEMQIDRSIVSDDRAPVSPVGADARVLDLERALSIGGDRPNEAQSRVATMARKLLDMGKNRQAEGILRPWLTAVRNLEGPNAKQLCWPQLQLGAAILKQGRDASLELDEAIRLANVHKKDAWTIAMILRYKAHNLRSFDGHTSDDIVAAMAILTGAITSLKGKKDLASLAELERLHCARASVNLELCDPEAAEKDVNEWQGTRKEINNLISQKADPG